MQTSRTFKTVVWSGAGPMVDMKITQEAQMLAWGNYKGKLLSLMKSNGTMKVDGIEVYKPIDLMGDIGSDKNNVNKLLKHLGVEDGDITKMVDAQGDLDSFGLDFNGANMVSLDMWELAMTSIMDALKDVDEIRFISKKPTDQNMVKYKEWDPWWKEQGPTFTQKGTSKIESYKIRLYDSGKEITKTISPDIRRAIIAGRLLEGDNALTRDRVEESGGVYTEYFDGSFKKYTLMTHYKETYYKDKEHAPKVFNPGGGIVEWYTSHIWAVFIGTVEGEQPLDPWAPQYGMGGIMDWHDRQDQRIAYAKALTKKASKFFHWSDKNKRRYLTVAGAKKLRLQDMQWVGAFINVYYSQDCGFWCGLFKMISGLIMVFATLIGTLLSFGNPTLKKIFTSIAAALITFYLGQFIGGGAIGMGSATAMDMVSMGINAFSTFQSLDAEDFNLEMTQKANDLAENKIDDPIEMVKIDGVGDATDWEQKYKYMYDTQFDQFKMAEIEFQKEDEKLRQHKL